MNFYNLLYRKMDPQNIERNAAQLNEAEGDESYHNYPAVAQWMLNAMRNAGLVRTECRTLPADGTTTYGDCTMPQAWNRTGRSYLQLTNGTMLADTDEDPFTANIWSAPCPEQECEILDAAVLAEETAEVRGKLIFFNGGFPRDRYRRFAEAGALGFVISDSKAGREFPDALRWCNGIGFSGWYHVKGDIRSTIFALTPRRAALLQQKFADGPVRAKLVMRTEIADGEIYTMTGVLPGKRPEEIVIAAHLYEPFMGDDAAGAASALELVKAMHELQQEGKLPIQEYSIRVVFGMERYAMQEFFGDPRRNRKMRWFINFDSVSSALPFALHFRRSVDTVPFAADYAVRKLLKKYIPDREIAEEPGIFSDDMFVSDPAIGIPSSWAYPKESHLHHNRGPLFFSASGKLGATISAIYGAVIMEMGEDPAGFAGSAARESLAEYHKTLAELRKAGLPVQDRIFRIRFYCRIRQSALQRLAEFLPGKPDVSAAQQWLEKLRDRELDKLPLPPVTDLSRSQIRAAAVIYRRIKPVLPMTIARVPAGERLAPPAGFDLVLGFCDGKNTLYDAIRSAEAAQHAVWEESRWKALTDYAQYWEKYGYLQSRPAFTTTPAQLRKALKKVGIRHNDRVIIHSSLAVLGRFSGGPEAVCKTCMELIGHDGTVMMPSFNFSHLKSTGGIYDPAETPAYTGAISERFRKLPGVCRSLDPSHPVAIWGRDAEEIAAHHHQVPTMGKDSPIGMLEQKGGKVLLIGCPNTATFMHVVETTNHVPCLGSRTEVYPVRLPDGRVVQCRGWGWRDRNCQYDGNLAPVYTLMRRAGTLHETMLGNAHIISFAMRDFRKAYEKLLHRADGCRNCPARPRRVAASVPSDWDAAHDRLMPSEAFTDDVKRGK